MAQSGLRPASRPKQYIYKRPRKRVPLPPAPRLPKYKEGEILTGQVMGQRASDLEERFARALTKAGIPFLFRYRIPAFEGAPIMNLAGEIEIDFLVFTTLVYPIQIDGEYAHKGAERREEDAMKDAIVDRYFASSGAVPVARIPHYLLTSQDAADLYVRRYIV